MYILYFPMAFLISLVFVYLFRKLAFKLNVVDNPNDRKIHEIPKAYLGGLGIYFAMLMSYLVYIRFDLQAFEWQPFLFSGLIVILGTYDDIKDMRAMYKLFFQLVIAFITSLWLGGIGSIQIYDFVFYFSNVGGILVQMFWFVVLINAFNLIDGLDGLAAGTGIISLTTLLLMGYMANDTSIIIFLIIIIGVLFGFLFYNFYPSTIFLGDGGSMLIGFMIGILSINNYKTATLTTTLLILLVAFLPILDATLSFIRRKVNGEKAFKADTLHFHHRLLLHGYSHSQSVIIMYCFMAIYSLSAIIISIASYRIKILVFFALICLTIMIIEKFYLLSTRYTYVSNFFRMIFKRR
jgi:UDP-GlcNAc:undecaprenyl-phosphate GlcNAc-1-phosphate transferase